MSAPTSVSHNHNTCFLHHVPVTDPECYQFTADESWLFDFSTKARSALLSSLDEASEAEKALLDHFQGALQDFSLTRANSLSDFSTLCRPGRKVQCACR